MKRYKLIHNNSNNTPSIKHFMESNASEIKNNVVEVDPDLKALYEAVEGLEASKPGSAEKFAKIIQTKYGITSTDNLKKFVLGCTKIPIGGVSIAGFALSISGAVTGGAELYSRIKSMGAAGLYDKLGFDISAAAVACIMLSFIFWKLFRFVISSSNKTESTNNKSYSEQKEILESEIFIAKMNQFIESDAGNPAVKLNATAEKADGICRRMFNWIKNKVDDGWGWIKKHPYITIAFLIVIGCVFYYISVLRGQIANLQGTVNDLQGTVNDLQGNNAELNSNIFRYFKDSLLKIDFDKSKKYIGLAKDRASKLLGSSSGEIFSRGLDNSTGWDMANKLIKDDIDKAMLSMDQNQFAAYFRCLYQSTEDKYISVTANRLAKSSIRYIKHAVGDDAFYNLLSYASRALE